MAPTSLSPLASSEAVAAHASWLQPHFMDGNGKMLMSIHAFLIESQGQRIVIDTCLGNDRVIPRYDYLSNLSGPFLSDIAEAGFPREDVDTVICTHLHFDHVGWNTMLVDGCWLPTFPRTRYLFSELEWDDIQTLAHPEDDAIVADCIQPVFEDCPSPTVL